MDSDYSQDIAAISRELDLIVYSLESDISANDWPRQREAIRRRIEEAIRSLNDLAQKQ